MSLPESTSFVEFQEMPAPSTIGVCRIRYAITVHPKTFEGYHEDAKNIIQCLKGERGGDLDRIAEAGLNAIGLDNLLAALAYEILNPDPLDT